MAAMAGGAAEAESVGAARARFNRQVCKSFIFNSSFQQMSGNNDPDAGLNDVNNYPIMKVMSAAGSVQPGLVMTGKLKSLPLCPIVINILRYIGRGRGHNNTRACLTASPGLESAPIKKLHQQEIPSRWIGLGGASGSLIRKYDLQKRGLAIR